MAEAWLSESQTEFLSQAYGPEDLEQVDRAILLLEDNRYRDENRYDLLLLSDDGKPVWAIEIGPVFLAFVEEDNGTVNIVHVSMKSRFRYGGPQL